MDAEIVKMAGEIRWTVQFPIVHGAFYWSRNWPDSGVAEVIEARVVFGEELGIFRTGYDSGYTESYCVGNGIEFLGPIQFAPNTRQRAERAAAKIFELFSGMHPSILWNSDKRVLTDIIAAEFDNHQ